MSNHNSLSTTHFTRHESASLPADQKRLKAIYELHQKCVLMPMADMFPAGPDNDHAGLYHGNVLDTREYDEPWQVQPSFNNGGDNTGNDNINTRSTLYASDHNTARDFARVRYNNAEWRHRVHGSNDTADPRYLEQQLHTIVSSNPNALILNHAQLYNTSKEELATLSPLLGRLRISAREGLTFSDSEADILAECANMINPNTLTSVGEVRRLTEHVNSPRHTELVKKLTAAVNTQIYFYHHAAQTVDNFLSSSGDFFRMDSKSVKNAEDEQVLLSSEYLWSMLEHNNIVGSYSLPRSFNLRKVIPCVSLFNLKTVNTKEVITKERERFHQHIGATASLIELSNVGEVQGHDHILHKLRDPHVTPQSAAQLLAAHQEHSVSLIMDRPIKRRKDQTLRTRIEATLSQFDNAYADALPATIVPMIRLALLADAASDADPEVHHPSIKELSAGHFLKSLNLNSQETTLILALLRDTTANHPEVEHSEDKDYALTALAINSLKEAYGEKGVSVNTIMSLREMRTIIKDCTS